MNWLNKILSKPDSKPAKAGAKVAAAPAAAPVVDTGQLRQRLAQALPQEERQQLERDLGLALARSGQAPAAGDAVGVRCAAVIQATDRNGALSWLADLTGEEALIEVALHARVAEVRRAAAQRLDGKAALERVAEGSRIKDKGVYRHCMTVLRERQAASDHAARAEVLQQELESLQACDPVPVARLVELEKQLSQLGSAGRQRCGELFELFDQLRARVQEQSRALQRLYLRQAEAQTLAGELSQPVHEEPCRQLQARWRKLTDGCAEWPSWLAEHKDLKALQLLLGEIETRLAQAAEDLLRLRQAEEFLAAHGQEVPLSAASIQAWEALDKPDHPQLRAELQARWQACLNHAAQQAKKLQAAQEIPKKTAPQAPPGKPAIDREVLKQRLDDLEAALEQGHLADAIKCEAAIGLPEGSAAAGLPAGLGQRLARAHAQLLQLRGWARWGSDQARQQLILKAEQLAQMAPDGTTDAAKDVNQLAAAIAELRQHWKSLDAHGAANHALWERFDGIVEKAYAPVAAHRAAMAAQRSAARVQKEAHCLEWEKWYAQINWEHADHQVIQAMRQELCVTWRAAPAADRRDERILQKRFAAILAGLDASLDAARNQEVARREALIAAAEALREEANLRRAIDGVKVLQQRWRDEAGSIKLGRGEQERLWKKFRGVCDAIFSRRAEEKDQQAAQRAQRAEEAKQRQAELELQAQQRRTPFELMAQKMAIAEQLEQAALSGTPLDELIQEAQAKWRELPRLPGKFEAALARRLADAPGATQVALAEGYRRREGLLLDLEIALGLASPQAQDESRRARQLELLQQRFSKSSATQADVDEMIIAWHATPATPDESQQRRMAAVLQKQLTASRQS